MRPSLAVTATLVALAVATPSRAEVAFVAKPCDQCQPEVYRMHDDGTDVRRVTTNEIRDTDPAWSPLGTAIAYVGWDSGDPRFPSAPQLFVASPDGGFQERVTSGQDFQEVFHPSWAADGRSIFFSGSREPTQGDTVKRVDLFRINPDGTGQTALTSGPGDDDRPVATPDGRHVIFVRYDAELLGLPFTGTPNLWVVDTTGGAPVPLSIGDFATGVQRPAISPDGTMLAFRAEQRLWVVRTDGTRVYPITDPPPPNPIVGPGFGADFPFWTADGRHVGFYDGKADLNGAEYAQVDVFTRQRTPFPLAPQAAWPAVLHPLLGLPSPVPDTLPPVVELTGETLADATTGTTARAPAGAAAAARRVPTVRVASGPALRLGAFDRQGIRSVRAAIVRRRRTGCAWLSPSGWRRFRCARSGGSTRIRNASDWHGLTARLRRGSYEVSFKTVDVRGHGTRRPQRFRVLVS